MIVGCRTHGDGSRAAARIGRAGELIESQGLPPYYEAAARGQIFHATDTSSGNNGTSISSSLITSGLNQTMQLGLCNPEHSGVNAAILRIMVISLSGTPGGGHYSFSTSKTLLKTSNQPNNQVTAGLVGTSSNGQNRSRCIVYTSAFSVGNNASWQLVSHSLHAPTSKGAIASGFGTFTTVENIDGAIVVEPGNIFTPAPQNVGTSYVPIAQIIWQEIPIAIDRDF